ncbi:MAG: DUF6465 family protein [Ruminococcus sp.]|nr:DUF6465 family protein [Ruminococcus sp.]
MATKKTTEEAKTTAVKAETAAAKPAEKKAPAAKKTTAAKKATAAKKPAAAKPAEKKVVTKVQYAANEYDVDELVEACKADYKTKTNGHVRSINLYIKPEEAAVYYVVNGKFNDKIDL